MLLHRLFEQDGQTTQTIRRQQPTTCLSVLDHFVGLSLKGLNVKHNNHFSDRFQFSKEVIERRIFQ